MNDRHPSGTMTTPAPASEPASAHYAPYGTQEAQYGGFTTYGVGYDASGFGMTGPDAGAHASGTFTTGPFYGDGSLQGNATDAGAYGSYHDGAAYDTGAYDDGHHHTGHHTAHDSGSYDATQWSGYDPYAAQQAGYDTGAYETTAWAADHQQLSAVPPQTAGSDTSGQWDAHTWLQTDGAPADPTQQWEWGTQAFDTGAYDATQWNTDGDAQDLSDEHPEEPAEEPAPEEDEEPTATGELPAVTPLLDDQEELAPLPAPRKASRTRRRTPARRSALLTVAVPSVCVMGVAGVAAASVVGNLNDDGRDTTASASDAKAVKPSAANTKLDSQLRSLSAGADDFADRASRTQERIDLRAQQESEKKKAAAEAARKERLRPKYAIPVEHKGLSAYFGQAGVNWMSVHTGIDFPVSYGTTVMAATDGTVRTQWNSAYGNMMIVTAMDGTETWYCHLSSYRVASGTTVKAGDPIAYSGNSGNSTGPHLHFEVRPGGGSAIDPLPWLRSHGLDPT
ncbi:M23 family metallopeptidase [Streptomyces sp. NPDC059378]|uniref:M23 family metallopeptidase n=1 Tax=Streptomyces sp. NPDC059378 TaxID=3346815 RepID=UPI0036B8F09A